MWLVHHTEILALGPGAGRVHMAQDSKAVGLGEVHHFACGPG